MFDGISKAEKIILLFLFYILTVGLLVSYIDKTLYEGFFVQEDKTIEWLTFAVLVFSSFLCFKRARELKVHRSKKFIVCTFLAGIIFAFGAGEEASWFQRQIGFKSPDYFVKNNSQREANIHNLVVKGKKVNKIVFGTGLAIGVCIYLLIFPLIYRRKEGFKKWVDSMAIPLPQEHHIVCYLLLFLITTLIPTPKRGELLELGGTCIFLMILLYPYNSEIYKK
jgi:hypothetical protein